MIQTSKYLLALLLILGLASCGSNRDDENTESDEQELSDTVVVDSLKLLDNRVERYPNQIEPLYERASYLIRQGSVAPAKEDLQSAVAIDSTSMKVRSLYADVLLSNLELEESKRHYDYVLGRDSLNVNAMMGMGKLYALLDNSSKSVYYLSEVLKVDPYNADAYFMKGMVYRSDYYKLGMQESWDRAMSSYQTAVEQDPNYYAAYVEMGVMHDHAGSDLALDYYRSALDVYPESIEAWYNIGMYYQTRGEVDKALETYNQLHEVDSTYPDAYFNHGYVHMIMTEDLDSALHFFNIAVDLDPEYFQAYNNIGLCYEKKGDLGMARSYYQKAVEINPDYQLAKDNLNALQ